MKWYEIAMKVPSKDSVYAPTGQTTDEDMSDGAAKVVNVSFDKDNVSNARPVTAYAKGIKCWFIKGDG